MPTYTANFNLTIPTVNADANVWGTLTNANWPIIDTQLKSLTDNKLGYNPTTFAVASRVNFTHANVQRGGAELATQTWVTSQIAASAVAGVPTGLIAMWHGLLSAIPAGWVLCNGANGTPDLRNRFVIGAANAANPGATGGSSTHDHGAATGATTLTVAQMPAHNHGITQTAHSHSITDKSHDHVVDPHSHTITITDPGHDHAINSVTADLDFSVDANIFFGADVTNHNYPDTPGGSQGVKSATTGITATASSTTANVDPAFTGITTTNTASAIITVSNQGGGGSHTHDISDANHTPPYYAVAFIMKV